MKYNIFENGGNSEGRVSINGLTMTGKLKLQRTAVEPNEAVNKDFVDNAATDLDASKIITGTLPVDRFPGLSGDVNSIAGSGILTLKNTGVVPGSYTKVTVNASGLVINGGSLVENDIPGFGWEKITSGKPTTLAGYGITNAVNRNDGTINGNITLSSAPVDGDDVVNKAYADSELAGRVGFATGDIVTYGSGIAPNGFLRCNGGEVSKTTYAALYAVIGDMFGGNLQQGSGQPWRQQYDLNISQNTDVTGWAAGTALPAGFHSSTVLTTKNRVYIFGGYTGAAAGNYAYTAPINSDGTLGAWAAGTGLPANIAGQSIIVTRNRAYLLGGWNGTAALTTVYTAPINNDGTIGTWTTGTALPGVFGFAQAFVTKNRVYLAAGMTGTNPVTTVYTAPINSDGTLGTWTTDANLPVAFNASQAVVTKNRVYLLGGYTGSAGLSSVYTAPINADGTIGSWVAGTSLPGTLAFSQSVVTRNRVYLFGGAVNSGASSLNTVYHAPINADGTLGTWVTGTSLSVNLSRSNVIVTSSKVFLINGWGSSASAAVYSANFSGGLNDYSNYYNGQIVPTTSAGNFRLPDYSSLAIPNSNYIIKF